MRLYRCLFKLLIQKSEKRIFSFVSLFNLFKLKLALICNTTCLNCHPNKCSINVFFFSLNYNYNIYCIFIAVWIISFCSLLLFIHCLFIWFDLKCLYRRVVIVGFLFNFGSDFQETILFINFYFFIIFMFFKKVLKTIWI